MNLETVLVAGNRGPCGGVNMALEAAKQVLEMVDGRESVFTNWDLVNNKPVMEELRQKGLISVQNNWDLAPTGSIVFFSAHGVPPTFHQLAKERDYLVINVSCQLVSRVHNLVKKAERDGQFVVYFGVNGHPETIGVLGEVSPQNIALIETVADVNNLLLDPQRPAIAYSQTTLATSELREQMIRLKKRFPHVEIPERSTICYATDNRQAALAQLLPQVESLLVVGSKTSHNSQELKKMGEAKSLPSYLVDYPEEIDPRWYGKVKRLGVTSGASVLERFLEPVLEWFRDQNPQIKILKLPQVILEPEMIFKLPQEDINRLQKRFVALS